MTPRRRHNARTKAGEGGGLLLQGSNARRNNAKDDRSSSLAVTAACWDGGNGDSRDGSGEASIRLAGEITFAVLYLSCCLREERD